jgi:hypothetical protein
LQTLNNIAAEQNSTIIFPVPMNLMEMFKQARPSDCSKSNKKKECTLFDPNETL